MTTAPASEAWADRGGRRFGPKLEVDALPCADGWRGVTLSGLCPSVVAGLRATSGFDGSQAPGLVVELTHSHQAGARSIVSGLHQVLEDGLRFVPLFPFDPDVPYLATFNHPGSDGGKRLELAFRLAPEPDAGPPRVAAVHPLTAFLPENLLRFHVTFAQPMRRGSVERAVTMLGPGGTVVDDALYRAPVELWDRSMTQLTVLLDPGRLKRGVGPNRELGPPLRANATYSLVLRSGMRAGDGRPLAPQVLKTFRTTEALRHRLRPEAWSVSAPDAGSRTPLVVRFPMAHDWALMHSGLDVLGPDGSFVPGRALVGPDDLTWLFRPNGVWSVGRHHLLIDPDFEDVCGNRVGAPFDRPVGQAVPTDTAVARTRLPFDPT